MIDISTGPRIGVDVGGTFTDCMVLDGHGHRLTTKASTTPSDPVQGVIASLDLAAEQIGVSLSELLAATRSFVHGTTMATNILVERRGTRTGLLMTRGH
ncbi:MAG: hydantoinase/oxoprolinase family protein, partial [Chloroflexi bacterium]|nr:hydantoinase/oxoprolinase family protein [Chloroflexota bacterium]